MVTFDGRCKPGLTLERSKILVTKKGEFDSRLKLQSEQFFIYKTVTLTMRVNYV